MPLSEIKTRARTLGRAVRMRNVREYVAAIVVIVLFGRLALTADAMLARIGACLIIAATAFVVYYLHTRSWVSNAAADEACLEFYRRELVRQRDVLRGVWWWYLLPFVPGFLLIVIARVAATPDRAIYAAITTLIALAAFVALGLLNERAAGKLQQDLDALDR